MTRACRAGVAARLRDLSLEFLECFERVNDVRASLKNIDTLPVALSTITFTGRLDKQQLPIDGMRLAANIAGELGDALEFDIDCDVEKARLRQKPCSAKRFRYQLPLRRNGKSLKLFHNGSVHATGCTSALEFLDMVDALHKFVRDTGNVEVCLVDFEPQLINTLFVLTRDGRPVTVAPGALLRRLNASVPAADFDTERHPSVKIPLVGEAGEKRATICVFQTGSVSIMGAKRPRHVADAFELACRTLDALAAEVCSCDSGGAALRTTTARHGLHLAEGYPFNLYCCCAGADV